MGYLDIDLEVHARYIASCVAALDEGYDVATALRVYKFSIRSLDRYLMSTGYRLLMQRVTRVSLCDTRDGL